MLEYRYHFIAFHGVEACCLPKGLWEERFVVALLLVHLIDNRPVVQKLPAGGDQVIIPAVGSVTLAGYDGLATAKDWFDPTTSCLVVNGTEYANIKQLMHAAHLSATPENIAAELGFKKVIVLPGMTARICIVPFSSIGFIARVPALVADYQESGIETDPDSGLSIGIVVAEEQKLNRRVVNGDLWFGCAAISASANATSTKGIIKVGTSA